MKAYMVYALFADGSMDARKFFLSEAKAEQYVEDEKLTDNSIDELYCEEIDIEE